MSQNGHISIATRPNHALYQAKLRPEPSGIIITIRHVVHPRYLIASDVVIQVRGESLFY
jgi:hypothetical protein